MATKANKEGLYEALRGNNVDTALAILDAKTMSPNMREPVENGVPFFKLLFVANFPRVVHPTAKCCWKV